MTAIQECNSQTRTMIHSDSGPSLPFPANACIDPIKWQYDCSAMGLLHPQTNTTHNRIEAIRLKWLHSKLCKLIECGAIHLEKPDTHNNPVLYFDDEIDLCIWTPGGQFKPKLLSLGSMGWGIFQVDKDYAYQRESLEALLKGCSLTQFQTSDGKLYDF
jgi:hypothetical protein